MKRLSALVICAAVASASVLAVAADEPARPFRAKDVFGDGQTILFQDDFQSGRFGRWNFSEDDRYRLLKETPERIRIVEAPGLGAGRKAVRFVVPRAPNSFRAEISLPHESGFNERWYGERVLVPADWAPDPGRGNDIVIQWHAIPGNWRATYPNLEISVGHTNWFIRQSFGAAQTGPTRVSERLADPVRPGVWAAWVVHAKWSPDKDGLLEIWKDGKRVLERKGPNVYSTIGVAYTPYLKTGIYRPEWHLDKEGKQAAFDSERPVATNKVIYVTDVKVGGERAAYEDVSPAATGAHP